MCGVKMTFSDWYKYAKSSGRLAMFNSEEEVLSYSETSKQAPKTEPLFKPSTNACVTTDFPLAVLIK